MSFQPDEPFAIVPLWLVESSASDRAVRLYALLSGLRDFSTDRVKVFGRRYLAERLGCSTDTVDRAKAELVKAGAVAVVPQRSSGGQEANEYVLYRVNPSLRKAAEEAERGPQICGGGGRNQGRKSAAPYTEEPESLFGSSSSADAHELGGGVATQAPPFPVKTVGGRKVTAMEQALARGILAAFNAQFATDFRGKEHVIGIVERIRERPDLSLDDHVSIIARFSTTTWWRKPRAGGREVAHPTPRHLYGSGRALDAAINIRADEGGQDDGLDAYTRGS